MTDMNKQTEALKLAEDALKRVRTQDMELVQMSMIALAALREAQASEAKEQPTQQQEPKLPEFYARFENGLVSVYQRREDAIPLLLLRENLPDKQPAPATELREQEPVAHCEAGPDYCPVCYKESKPTYGSEEIRKLREVIANQAKIIANFELLTDEEISEIAINTPPMVHEFARAIEAKLKEKNT